VLIDRQNNWNCGRIDFKQCITCVKVFMCSSYDCVSNGTLCTVLRCRIVSSLYSTAAQ
jgi:hypothetical protein